MPLWNFSNTDCGMTWPLLVVVLVSLEAFCCMVC
jgi:hypothetical protein